MFKQLRIAFLLYILLFVAAGTYLARARSTDWDEPLWVDVYLVNGSGDAATQAYLDTIERDRFGEVERFFQTEASRHGVGLDRPFRLDIAGQLERRLPDIPPPGSVVGTMLWSLQMRWFTARLKWSSDRPTPDIVLFAVYHNSESTPMLERSTALRNGLIAIANVFGVPHMRGSNSVVMAHELLHTVGATDKYDPATNLPLFPIGYADPHRAPRHPQNRAELMGGRIPVSPSEARIPKDLRQVSVGPATAFEIGWRENPDIEPGG